MVSPSQLNQNRIPNLTSLTAFIVILGLISFVRSLKFRLIKLYDIEKVKRFNKINWILLLSVDYLLTFFSKF